MYVHTQKTTHNLLHTASLLSQDTVHVQRLNFLNQDIATLNIKQTFFFFKFETKYSLYKPSSESKAPTENSPHLVPAKSV